MDKVLKLYMNEGAFGLTSHFGKDEASAADAGAVLGFFIMFVIIVVLSFVIGWLAVSNICKGSDTRSKNIRLGLYAMLLLSGGRLGWLYVLLWIFRVNVCG